MSLTDGRCRHSDFICHGKCALSRPSYPATFTALLNRFRSKLDDAFQVSTQAGMALLNNELGFEQTTCLFVTESHCYQTVIDIMSDILVQRVMSKTPKIEEVHLLLTLAVNLNNSPALRQAMNIKGIHIPPCLLAWLLRKSVYCEFDDGTRILLRNGVSPVTPLSKTCQSPVAVCLRMMNSRDQVSPRLLKIFSLLIGHALNRNRLSLTSFDFTSVRILALRSRQAAELLIDSIALISPALVDQTMQVWFSSINVVHLSPSRHVDSIALGLLPLLRAGARCDHSFSLLGLVYGDANAESAILRLWNRLEVPLAILIESRKSYSSIHPTVFEYFEKIGSHYPCSLQAIARQAVLRCLSTGIKRRQHDINRLLLPQCFGSYLNFNEFSI